MLPHVPPLPLHNSWHLNIVPHKVTDTILTSFLLDNNTNHSVPCLSYLKNSSIVPHILRVEASQKWIIIISVWMCLGLTNLHRQILLQWSLCIPAPSPEEVQSVIIRTADGHHLYHPLWPLTLILNLELYAKKYIITITITITSVGKTTSRHVLQTSTPTSFSHRVVTIACDPWLWACNPIKRYISLSKINKVNMLHSGWDWQNGGLYE